MFTKKTAISSSKKNITCLCLRNDLLRPNFPNSTRYINSLFYKDITLYNALPNRLKELSNKKFKASIKKILTENVFYSVSEYVDFFGNE